MLQLHHSELYQEVKKLTRQSYYIIQNSNLQCESIKSVISYTNESLHSNGLTSKERLRKGNC